MSRLQALSFQGEMRSDFKLTSQSAPSEPFPVNVAYKALDLCSQESIRSFVTGWSEAPITHLILNAGANVMGKPTFTAEGIESTFASNHTGHALLVLLLIKEKHLAEDCSIVFVTSSLHDSKSPGHPAVLWSTPASVAACEDPRLQNEPLVRYGTAKFGAVLFMWALRRRAKETGKRWRINVFEPGFAPGRGSKLGRGGSLDDKTRMISEQQIFRGSCRQLERLLCRYCVSSCVSEVSRPVMLSAVEDYWLNSHWAKNLKIGTGGTCGWTRSLMRARIRLMLSSRMSCGIGR